MSPKNTLAGPFNITQSYNNPYIIEASSWVDIPMLHELNSNILALK